MAFRRPGRPGPEAAERLLDAVAAGAGGSQQSSGGAPDPLGHLLAAAAAPARPGELDGEDAAVAAFRAARDARSTVDPAAARATPRRAVLAGTPDRPPARRRRLTAGAGGWIAVALATLTAGAALATEIPVLRPAGPSTGTPGGGTSPTEVVSTPPATTGPASAPLPPATEPPLVEPSRPGRTLPPPHALAAQCRAFLKGRPDNGSAANRPPSALLIRAAGGRAQVEGYCRRLLADAPKPNGKESHRPHGKGAPADPPGAQAEPPGGPAEPAGNPADRNHAGSGAR